MHVNRDAMRAPAAPADPDQYARAQCREYRHGGNSMPYATNAELPVALRHRLPAHAQDIFREAFDAAWSRYAGHPRREEIAFRIGWSAVKKGFVKAGTDWVARPDPIAQ
jgi:cation transport regulator